MTPLSLFLGWLLDLLFGDPAWLPHPVVGMGRWIAWWERRLNRGTRRKAKGALLVLLSIALIFLLTALITRLFFMLHCSLYILWSTLLIFFCLAGHTLRREVRMVFEALDRNLDEGRRQVARIVGRDTQALSAQEVRTAALETLAENLSDGVVAPLFWLCLLGVPGMVTYKLINTFDSMIGYRTDRYRDFGCWAARIDDVANFIPARLTAFLMLLVGSLMGKRASGQAGKRAGRPISHLTFLFRYAPKHASPNSGWPEAALAALLDCRFGGTHNYFGEEVYKPYIGTNPRLLTTDDMQRSIRICFAAEVLAVLLAVLLAVFFAALLV